MAIYTEDFSGGTVGQPPSGWTSQWDTDWATTLETDVTGFGGQFLKVNPGTTDARRILTMDAIDSDANRDNVEVLMRHKLSSHTSYNNQFGVLLRGSDSGDSSTANGYYCIYHSYYLLLGKYVGGTSNTLVYQDLWASFEPDLSDRYWWMRFRVNGSSLKVKLWFSPLLEPGAWTFEETNSEVTGVGWAGIWNYDDFSTLYASVDYFAVGTNGDSPSLPVAADAETHLQLLNTDIIAGGGAYNDVRFQLLNTDIISGGGAYNDIRLQLMSMDILTDNTPVTGSAFSPAICINT